MPIENDILALVQESSKDPNGFTPETAAKVVTRLKQFHSEKQAKAAQRKAQNINSPDEDAELADYDSKLNDKEYVNEFLPQLLYEESQRIRTPQAGQGQAAPAKAEPKSFWDQVKELNPKMGGGMSQGFIPPENAASQMKVIAELFATGYPGMQIPSMAGKAAFSGLPLLMMAKRLWDGGKPQDLSVSAAQTAMGGASGKLVGPAADGLNRAFKLKPGGFNPIEVILSGLSGGANAAVPPMFNDQEGFGGPDEETASRFIKGTALGSLFGLGKQFIGNSVAGTGTKRMERVNEDAGIPNGAPDEFGAPALGSPRVIDLLSSNPEVLKTLRLHEALSRQQENEKVVRAALGGPAPQGGVRPDPALTSFGTTKESVRSRIVSALDGVFKPRDAQDPIDQAANEASEMGKALIKLHKGDKNAAVKAVLGYLAERFYRAPVDKEAPPADALRTFVAVGGGERLLKMFQGMGLTPKEAAAAVSKGREAVTATDKINRMQALAGTPAPPALTAVSGTGNSRFNIADLVNKAKPSIAIESLLRGQNPVLSADQQKVLAGWLRRTEKSPLTDMGGATSAIQTVFSGARDPEKR
jgi:hypothetical protein